MSTEIDTDHAPKAPLPQSGWVNDTVLAAAIGVTPKTLREFLREFSIEHIRFKTAAIINMETFFEQAPKQGSSSGKEKKRPRA